MGGGFGGFGGFGGYAAPALYWPMPVQAPTNTAKIHVTLPADAKLTIDGSPTASTSETRIFESPSLTPGKTFFYELKATVVRDGKTETVTKEVTVRAGEDTRVEIEIPETTAAED
jgi:uncharacterized protein (TIGR03000 family)